MILRAILSLLVIHQKKKTWLQCYVKVGYSSNISVVDNVSKVNIEDRITFIAKSLLVYISYRPPSFSRLQPNSLVHHQLN